MKTLQRLSLISVLMILIFIMSACEETTTMTEIFPDGSCKRTIVVKSDSEKILEYGFPLPTGPSWTVVKKKEKEKVSTSRQYLYTAEKSFASIADLNSEYTKTSGDPLKVKVEVKLEKRFAWFFSYLTYREVYHRFFPFDPLPLKDFFPAGELDIIKLQLTDEDKCKELYSEELLAKLWKTFDTWFNRSLFEPFHRLVVEKSGQLSNSQLKPQDIAARKEVLYKAIFKDSEFLDDMPHVDQMLKKYEEVLGNADVNKIKDLNKEEFLTLEEKYRALNQVTMDEFVNTVSLPGILTDTNAKMVTGNRVNWEFTMVELMIGDKEMWVTSRRINWWMVVIAGFVVLVVIILLIAGTIFRKSG